MTENPNKQERISSALILSVNRKALLVKAFVQAAHELEQRGNQIAILTADSHPAPVASHYGDGHIQLPLSTHPDYSEALLHWVQAKNIRLIVPSRDAELMLLSRLRSKLEHLGCSVFLPDEVKLSSYLDKERFSKLLEKKGFKVIPTLKPEQVKEGEGPWFKRLRRGSSSMGAGKVVEYEEAYRIASGLVEDKDLLLHPYFSPDQYEEFSIDVYVSGENKVLDLRTRKRDIIQGGEAKVTSVMEEPELSAQARDLACVLELRGHNVIQAFMSRDRQDIVFIEVNLRFGGASHASFLSGLLSPYWSLKEALGYALVEESISPRESKEISVFRAEADFAVPRFFQKELRNKRPHTLLIDLDDTLFEEKSYVLSGYRALSEYVAKESSIPFDVISEWMHHEFFIYGRSGLFDKLKKKFQLTLSMSDLVYVYRHHVPQISLYPQVRKDLRALREQFRLILATNGEPTMQKNKVAALNLDPLFSEIVYCSEQGQDKPSSDSLEHLLRQDHLDTQRILMIGDDPWTDGRLAAKLDIDFHRVRTGRLTEFHDPEALAKQEWQNFHDLAQAILKSLNDK